MKQKTQIFHEIFIKIFKKFLEFLVENFLYNALRLIFAIFGKISVGA